MEDGLWRVGQRWMAGRCWAAAFSKKELTEGLLFGMEPLPEDEEEEDGEERTASAALSWIGGGGGGGNKRGK